MATIVAPFQKLLYPGILRSTTVTWQTQSIANMILHLLVVAIIATTLLLSSGFEIEENFNLKPRTQAPRFKAKAVLNDKFVNVALDEYISAQKWTVLLFYPFDYTFVCPVSSYSPYNGL
jgi:hypothetical protein